MSHLGLLPNFLGTVNFFEFSLQLWDPQKRISDNGFTNTLVTDVAKPSMPDSCWSTKWCNKFLNKSEDNSCLAIFLPI